MGILARLGRLIRGFFSIFVGGMEEKNPEYLFEDIKGQIEKARKEAEEQIVAIQTNAEMIKIEMKTAEKNLATVQSRIEMAKKQGDKDILVELLVQEEEYMTVFEASKSTFDNAMSEVTKIREDYKIFESEMSAKLTEIKSLKSQAKMANLRENINSVNAKYTSKGNKVGNLNAEMERARDLVNTKTAKANAVESLSSDNVDLKLKRLDMDSARDRAKARAEAMLSGDQGFEVKEKTSTLADETTTNNENKVSS